MNTLLTLFIFIRALQDGFQDWFKDNMQQIVLLFIISGIIDWIIIIKFFTKIIVK